MDSKGNGESRTDLSDNAEDNNVISHGFVGNLENQQEQLLKSQNTEYQAGSIGNRIDGINSAMANILSEDLNADGVVSTNEELESLDIQSETGAKVNFPKNIKKMEDGTVK